MSHGASAENVKEVENNLGQIHSKKKRRSRVDDFGFSVAKVAVAQICEAAGFQGFQRTALDTLSEVATRYIQEIGCAGNSYANLAGRSQCNVFDIIQGLEDLGSIQGFSGASDVHHCLLGSGTVQDMVRYVEEAEEIPFAYSLPGFPVPKDREPCRTFKQSGVSPPAEYIPPWLPVFPDPETFIDLHKGDEKTAQSREGEEVGNSLEKRTEVDKTLANLHTEMPCNGSEPSVVVDFGNGGAKGKGSMERNPFLTPPLQHGEKVVSLIPPPAKLSDDVFLQTNNHEVPNIPAMETFAPGSEAVSTGTCNNIEDGREEVSLNGRPNVQFKLGGGKKYLNVVISSQNGGMGKNFSWFLNDDGTDDEKRLVEQFLKSPYESAATDSFVN